MSYRFRLATCEGGQWCADEGMGVGAHQLLNHAQVVWIHVLEREILPLSLSLSRYLWIQPLSGVMADIVVDVVRKKSYCPRETRKAR